MSDSALGSDWPKRHVVAGVDFSEQTALVIDRALELSASRDAMLHVAHATRDSPHGALLLEPSFPRHLSLVAAEQELAAVVTTRTAHAPHVPPRGVMTHVFSGDPARALSALAADLDAELIVVGTHDRRGLSRFLHGSVTRKLVRRAPCPVIVVREREPLPELAPACPACVVVRRQTAGRELWCEQHQHNLGRRHTYHYTSRNVSAHENMPLVLEPSDAAAPLRH